MKKETTKKSFWKTFHQYRLKIALAAFLIIIPVVLLFAAYISPLVQSTRVSFDQEITEESTFISSFKDLQDVEDVYLGFTWKKLILPTEDAEGNLVGGSFVFSVNYNIDENIDISNVRVIVSLQPRFTTFRDVSAEIRLTNYSSRDVFVNHNLAYPLNPLWFVTINEPTVYIKLMYDKGVAGELEPITVTEYVKVSLANVDPLEVS